MSIVASIRFLDLLAIAGSSLRRSRLRSFLTIGAIAFGISIMMYLISLGFGLERIAIGGAESSPALLSLSVNPASEELQPITADSLARIRSVAGVKQVLPQLTAKGELTLGNQRAQVTILGVDPEYLSIDDSSALLVGHAYRAEDQQVMVVSTGFLKQFGLEEGKNPLVTFQIGFSQDDFPGAPALKDVGVSGVVEAPASAVYLPRPYLEQALGVSLKKQSDAGLAPAPLVYHNVKVTVPNLDTIDPVKNELIRNGFRVSTVSDTIQDIRRVFAWIRGVLGALGCVAIFVASIGMFNTLTISLLERTREIGIMRALGVRKVDIIRLFLMESFLIGLLGGIAGIITAFVFQQATLFALSLLASLVPAGKVPSLFLTPWYLVLGFLGLSALIAGITGIYPARRASRLNPIEAIRYE